jgi:hypothetical protein
MGMNQIRGITVSANTSINGINANNARGNLTRLRGFHMASRGGAGDIHFSDTVQPSIGFRMYVIANSSDNLTLPDSGVKFPAGVSVSVPTSVVATLFLDP